VSSQSRCRFLLVAQVCPTAIPNRPRHPFRLLTGPSSVAFDVHGSLDRAKDVSSSCGGRVVGAPAGVECVRLAYADDVPLLVLPEDTRLSSVRRMWRKRPATHVRTNRPRPVLLRQPAKVATDPTDQGAFHRRGSRHGRGSLLFVSYAGLPLTPPTRCPQRWGQVLSDGALQASTRTFRPVPTSRVRCAFENPRLVMNPPQPDD
jgi:hypothetical protein